MIKNVIFDLGNVLINFNPAEYMISCGLDKQRAEKVREAMFSTDWNEYDRGTLPHVEDLLKSLLLKFPELEAELTAILKEDWVKIHSLNEDSFKLFCKLKENGYGVYILSNLSFDSLEYIKQFDFYSMSDGSVFSCDEGFCKPEKNLYDILLERYNLTPDECAFLDDRTDNIAAANELGIHGIVFESSEQAAEQLKAMGIII